MKRGEGNRERGERERGGKYRVKLHGHTYTDNLTCMRMKELVPVQQTLQQLLRRPCQGISLRITVDSTASILVDIHKNP